MTPPDPTLSHLILAARDDLHDIVVFIARDNPERAMSFGYQLISETDRLQTFPDSFRFLGTKTEIARQIGNAVPPLLAARIADCVLALLTNGLEP